MASLSLSLRIVPRAIDTITIDTAAAAAAALRGHTNATELADYLVARGLPFRDAHHDAGRIVRRALDLGLTLDQLPLAEMQAICPAVEGHVFTALTPEAGLARRELTGGTGPAHVADALDDAAARLDTLRRSIPST
ncbi:hypothetical protein J4558_19610 [Leptolyngbya sp. 15MV]|nr:hypothetical protein J4558_19610 [Leptolyngbya sp. 15MV]